MTTKRTKGGRSSAPVLPPEPPAESIDRDASGLTPAPGAVGSAGGPESPAPSSPAPPAELAAALPDVAGGEPANVEAAIAALEPTPEIAPAPDAGAPVESAGQTVPGTAPPAPAVKVERWSRNKIRSARKRDLARRVEELQGELQRVAPRPAPGGATAAVASALPPGEELREQLELLMPGISAMLEHFIGSALRLDEKEQRLLARTWAPVGAPGYEQLRGRLPLVPALLTTVGVVGPKVLALLQQMAERKRAAGDAVHDGPAPAAPAAEVLSPAAPFGGPSE